MGAEIHFASTAVLCSVLAAGAGHVILIILLSLLIGTASGLLLIVGGGLDGDKDCWFAFEDTESLLALLGSRNFLLFASFLFCCQTLVAIETADENRTRMGAVEVDWLQVLVLSTIIETRW
ncbi:unnamed protein product [Citrullus colocynthis]|uniref:Uncharacterized protein n=1 Tax=Citrullus colocynthis TaxID=252529 RepID=A0ABP0ZD67_9ROSI